MVRGSWGTETAWNEGLLNVKEFTKRVILHSLENEGKSLQKSDISPPQQKSEKLITHSKTCCPKFNCFKSEHFTLSHEKI